MKRRAKTRLRSPPAGKSLKENRPAIPPNQTFLVSGICLFLAAITLIVFSQTFHYGFINYDDGAYVSENAAIQKGLTLDGIGWAFTHTLAANWHPLTTISLMLDYQLYGLNAGAYHLTNVLLHAIAAILLFFVLKELTGTLWRSAFVAAMFAVHPLRVESVAWIAERKDVLGGVFFMLTLWAYVRYVRRPFSIARYLLVALLLALGLMCKPMLVTLPFLLLLLDYWPLNRFDKLHETKSYLSIFRRLLLEKIPLLVISALGCVAALMAQKNAVALVTDIGIPLRISNALVSYLILIGQMFYPSRLAVYYPLAAHLPAWEVAGSVLFLLAISAGILYFKKRYLLVGWLWYLGMLVPVIGLVQVGSAAHADRYTYLPQIGLYLALTWGIAELFSGWPYRRPVLGLFAVAVIAILSIASFDQTAYWRDSESLWNHTIACTKDNAVARNNLGMAFMSEGKVAEAIGQYQKALEIEPAYTLVHFNLGAAYGQKGDWDQAIEQYQKTIELQPDYLPAHNNLADALLHTGQTDKALQQLQEAFKLSPKSTMVCDNIGFLFLRTGQINEAAAQFEKTLEMDPNDLDACHYLARILATSPEAGMRKGPRAIELARKANELSGGKDPDIVNTLSAAYANAGQFPDAIATAQLALQQAAGSGDNVTVNQLQAEIALYRENLPVRDSSLANIASH
ncbi:MAG TPA: tetratricopeptide repeat protein [Pseudomonadales bacterium]|nr:tetratricopeptide repeat protein [Pseudomonadales bacterium]